MNCPSVAELIVMFLYNGSDATYSVAVSLLPRVLSIAVGALANLTRSSERSPERDRGDAGKPYDVNDLEAIVLKMQDVLGLQKCLVCFAVSNSFDLASRLSGCAFPHIGGCRAALWLREENSQSPLVQGPAFFLSQMAVIGSMTLAGGWIRIPFQSPAESGCMLVSAGTQAV